MERLVKIYNSEQIDNLISVLTFKPRKVVFIYDSKETNTESLFYLEKACVREIPGINFEFVPVDGDSLDDVCNKCKKIIRSNPSCYFDITGGKELMVVGAYSSCTKDFIPTFKLNLDEYELINVYGSTSSLEDFKLPNISLDAVVTCAGGSLEKSSRPTPEEDQFGWITTFCRAVFEDIPAWKELCLFIQNGAKNTSFTPKPLEFHATRETEIQKGKLDVKGESLLNLARDIGMISELEVSKSKVSFNFKSDVVKKYMTDFGGWLELYSYVTILKSGLFNDARFSVKIDWGGDYSNRAEIVNEIDVTFFSGISPVFLSCKISDPSAEALQELSVYRSYFGGKRSRCILVTMSDVKLEKPYVFHRAMEMGILIIDKSDIKSGKMMDRIVNFLKVKA